MVVKDNYGELWFYRHSDGYPSCTGESLKRFLRWLIDGKIRDNAEQASGWLILMGAEEYSTNHEYVNGKWQDVPKVAITEPTGSPSMSWKCGAYEPSLGEHGDIEYLYVIDLKAKEIRCSRPGEGRKSPFYVVNATNIDKPITDAEGGGL